MRAVEAEAEEVVEDAGSPAAVVAILLAILALLLCGFLFYQIHVMAKNNASQVSAFQNQQANLNNQVNTALAHLDQADTSIEAANQLGGQTILASLQMLLLQGQPKILLEKNMAALQLVVGRLNHPEVTTLSNSLASKINALPDVNPADAQSRLTQISQSFASLSFIPAVGAPSQVVIPANVNGFWARLWYSIRGLIVVRTDNQIGTALVTDASRIDALRTLNLQVEEANWQLLHNEDPTPALIQLKTTLVAFTAADANQASCLAQIAALIDSHDFYAAADVSAILNNIASLQASI